MSRRSRERGREEAGPQVGRKLGRRPGGGREEAGPGPALDVPGHLDHRAAEPQPFEQALRALVRGGRPQHHAGDALLAHPGDGGLHQRAGDAAAAFRLVDDDVVDEAGGVAQLLPRERLDAGEDVADRGAGALRDEDDASSASSCVPRKWA